MISIPMAEDSENPAMPSPHPEPLPARLVVWGCGTVLGLLAADAVIGAYEAGLSPFKPSWFALLSVAFCAAASLLSGLRFAPVALLILALPMARLFDAAVLARVEVTFLQQISMDLMRMMVVLFSILAVLSTDQGLRAARVAAVLAILLTVGSEVYEMLGFAKFTTIQGRYAGFNGHPNFPPILLCEMLGICFALVPSFRFNCLLIGLSFVGVALTYGRSGFIVLTLMAGAYVLLNLRKNLGFVVVMALLAIPAAGVLFAVLQSRTQHGILKDQNTAERLEAILTLDFDKLKSPERAQDLSDAWEAVLEKPLFGHGTGVSGTIWAPHNEWVSIWLELGIPGLLLFGGTFALLVLRSVMTGGRAGYLVFAMLAFTPAGQGRIETPHFMLALATAAHLLWPARYRFRWRNPAPATG